MGSIAKEEGQATPQGGSEAGLDERWVVEVVDGERHEFQTGDIIRFVDVFFVSSGEKDLGETCFSCDSCRRCSHPGYHSF